MKFLPSQEDIEILEKAVTRQENENDVKFWKSFSLFPYNFKEKPVNEKKQSI